MTDEGEQPYQPRWLQPTYFMDHDDPAVSAYARDRAGSGNAKQKAISLYYAVRDEFRYDPYRVIYAPEGFVASGVLERGYGFCLPKATLLAACARAVGIPARLGYGDVRNHLTTERLRDQMRSDIFVFHGYAQLWIDDQWVKATPAFNKEMCDRFGVKPLEFDGETDSLFHAFDAAGRRHMEYIRDRGIHDDVPFDTIMAAWREAFPEMVAEAMVDGKAEGAAEFQPD